MQTSRDEHQVQQNDQRRGGPTKMRREHFLQQRRACSNHQANQGKELDCARQAVGRERHLRNRQPSEELKRYRHIHGKSRSAQAHAVAPLMPAEAKVAIS